MAEPENEARRRQKHQTPLARFDHRCLPVNVLWLDQTRRAGEEAFLLAFDSDCLDAIALMAANRDF
jgi:hypothetical protein